MGNQITTLVLGLGLGGGILWLVRRDQLHGPYALWWILVAIGIVALGIWPRVVDRLAAWLGVAYPPILIVVLGFGFVLIKMLTLDLARSRQERRIRRLAQRLALLEEAQHRSRGSP